MDMRAKEQRARRGIMTGVRGLRERREHAMDEYASALLDMHTFRERAAQAQRRAHELKIAARRAGNTAAELKSVEELVDERWQASLDEIDDTTTAAATDATGGDVPDADTAAADGAADAGVNGASAADDAGDGDAGDTDAAVSDDDAAEAVDDAETVEAVPVGVAWDGGGWGDR